MRNYNKIVEEFEFLTTMFTTHYLSVKYKNKNRNGQEIREPFRLEQILTLKKVLTICAARGRNQIPMKEFLIDLREVANEEDYALCAISVESNPRFSIGEFLRYIKDEELKELRKS